MKENMRIKLRYIVSATIFLIGVVIGRADESNEWGEAVNGVQLSISASNSVVPIGSNIVISAQIRNSSTNSITVYVREDPNTDFKVYLISESGKAFKISPERIFDGEVYSTVVLPISMAAGESRKWIISEIIGNDIDLGDYTLKVTAHIGGDLGHFDIKPPQIIHTGGSTNSFEIESNLLKVHIN